MTGALGRWRGPLMGKGPMKKLLAGRHSCRPASTRESPPELPHNFPTDIRARVRANATDRQPRQR